MHNSPRLLSITCTSKQLQGTKHLVKIKLHVACLYLNKKVLFDSCVMALNGVCKLQNKTVKKRVILPKRLANSAGRRRSALVLGCKAKLQTNCTRLSC